MNYVRALAFTDTPDYNFLREMFRELFNREGYTFDYIFDWTALKYQETQKDNRLVAGVPSPQNPQNLEETQNEKP